MPNTTINLALTLSVSGCVDQTYLEALQADIMFAIEAHKNAHGLSPVSGCIIQDEPSVESISVKPIGIPHLSDDTCSIEFATTYATCFQHLEIIDSDYDREKIISGLRLGELQTTTWHEAGKGKVPTISKMNKNISATENVVAYIIGQGMQFDNCFSQYS